MMIISMLTGLGSVAVLLFASFLFGFSKGSQKGLDQKNKIRLLEDEIAYLNERSSRHSSNDDDRLTSTIQKVLAPLVERERQSLDLSHIQAFSGQRRDLSPLLDRIATAGNFSTVLLANDEGLPLGASFTSHDLDAMAAESSRLMLAVDQIAREQDVTALSIMVYYEPDAITLCRMFDVNGQRLSLTAISHDTHLTPVALDPALMKIRTALSAASSSSSKLQISGSEMPAR